MTGILRTAPVYHRVASAPQGADTTRRRPRPCATRSGQRRIASAPYYGAGLPRHATKARAYSQSRRSFFASLAHAPSALSTPPVAVVHPAPHLSSTSRAAAPGTACTLRPPTGASHEPRHPHDMTRGDTKQDRAFALVPLRILVMRCRLLRECGAPPLAAVCLGSALRPDEPPCARPADEPTVEALRDAPSPAMIGDAVTVTTVPRSTWRSASSSLETRGRSVSYSLFGASMVTIPSVRFSTSC